LPRRPFDVITMSPSCTEFSKAKTVGTQDLVGAIAVFKKALKIIRYFWPSRWWLETLRFGLLPQNDFMQVFPFLDVDDCQCGDGGFRKPNRFYGSGHILALTPALCDGVHCKNLAQGQKHLRTLGGPFGPASRKNRLI